MALGLLLPGVAWGADVRLSMGVSTEYDSNVFRSPNDEKNDVVFRFTPRVAVVEDREKLNYSAGYSLPYEIGVKYQDVRDLNHLVDSNFSYRLTPQTELFGNNAFFYVRGLYRQDDLANPAPGEVGDGRERVLQNNLALGTTHFFTPRLSGTLRFNQGVLDTTQFDRADALTFGGTASSAYQLTEHHQLGGGFSYTRQNFDETFNRPKSDTDYYNLFGSWRWTFDETTNFDIQLGPALIHSNQKAPNATLPDQEGIPFQVFSTDTSGNPTAVVVSQFDTCPVVNGNPLLFDNAGAICGQRLVTDPLTVASIVGNQVDLSYVSPPEGVTDTRITYFANASLTKRWSPNLMSNLNYARQDDTASGIDGGATLDAVTLTSSWRISDRWDASVRTDWTLRKSATNGSRVFVIVNGQPLINDFNGDPFSPAGAANLLQDDSADSLDTQRWGAAARLAYRLTKNTVTALQYAYNRQSSHGDTVGQSSDFDDHLVTFTVQYNFEPIGLWW
ncbi:MAG TPA: hypothetical protein VII72_11175 [Myxococcota bacterium]|jgi:hypothetical protein